MRVAVIGSSHSRDVFNSKFVENYRENFQLDAFYMLTSMLTIMSKPIDYDYNNFMKAEVKDSVMEHYFLEFEKPMLKTLESNQPDILLLDFHADARHGARAYGAEYLTDKLFAVKNKDILNWKNLGIIYSHEKNTDSFIMMWKNAFDRFMAFVKEKLPNTLVVVNTVKGTKEVTDSMGNLYVSEAIVGLDIDRINALWEIFDDYAIRKYKLKALRFEKEYTLDADYVYGLGNGIIHFHKEYFEDCYEKLVNIANSVAFEERSESEVNKVSGSDFKKIEENWKHIVGSYEKLPAEGYNAIKAIPSEIPLGNVHFQMWSKAIEIQGDGNTEYTLSFFIKVPSLEGLEEDSFVFTMRTFRTVRGILVRDAVQRYPMTLKGHDIKPGEEYRYEYTFKPRGRFIKLAPILTSFVPGVEYSRIKLERAQHASEYTK